MDEGVLVPDEVVIGMIESKVDANKKMQRDLFLTAFLSSTELLRQKLLTGC